MDPVTTPLLILVLGNLARELIADACKDYLKDKLKSFFGWMERLGERDKVELTYQTAMEQAYSACLEMLLLNIKSFGYSDEELKEYRSSIEAFIKDDRIAKELLNAIREPGRDDLPSPDVLRERWKAVGGKELPSDILWNTVAAAFRRQATKQSILSDELRELLNAQNLQQLKELIEHQGGVKVQVRRGKYSHRMQTKFSPVDLANLMPAYADDPGRMVIRDVFVAQNVRENPPPVEIPKDLAERLRKGGRYETSDDIFKDFDEQQLEELHTAYVSQSPKPVLDVIATPSNRLLVLIGEPGSGKSTLMRYLLTGIIEPPVDPQSGKPFSWTDTFKDVFPLLIELRDFYALRRSDECDSFLEYVAYMGKTDQWFLDDHALHDHLENGPSLVMFDGLDEIFDTADRERVMHEIAGFAQRYPRARIIVTSRPVGYKEQVLRNAGFEHFGIQDLNDEQIEAFICGWFALTFPQRPQRAKQRIERVLGSVRQSKPIRLLAGNPMLLTIMALLAREQELPRERAKFYEKAVEVLCHHWDANRNLQLPEVRYLNADDKKDLLRRIAMRMQAGEAGLKGNFIQEDNLEQEIQAFLIDEQWQPNVAEARKAARRMIRQLRERNYILCLRGPHLYGFVHRTFLEYLTAADFVHRFHIEKTLDIEGLIALFDKHCRDDEWREVLRLICGQIDEQFVGQIVEHLTTRMNLGHWDGITPLPELSLAINCLSEVRGINRLESAGVQILEVTIEVAKNAGNTASARPFLMDQLLVSCRELGERWPGRNVLDEFDQYAVEGMRAWGWGEDFWPHLIAFVLGNRVTVESFAKTTQGTNNGVYYRSAALQALADKWPDDTTRNLLENRALQDEDSGPRSAALQALADKWPDDTTRNLLEDRATQDEHEYTRSAALRVLADKWPDDTTHNLLEGRALQDEDSDPRSAALQALADKWPDDTTRNLLEDRALQDEDFSPRSAALRVLADKWPDDTTRNLLEDRAVQDEHEFPRSTAFQVLADKWPDDTAREFLEERTIQDQHEASRSAALWALAETWPDDTARKLLEERAIQDEHEYTRSTALQTLAETWPDDTTRNLLEERATQDEDSGPRSAALQVLANKWPDDTTRNLLEDRAVQDEHEDPRSTALQVLANKWPDESTRNLLEEGAVQDEHEDPRSTALRALAEKWPDESTRKLLEERALQDEHEYTRSTALQALADTWPDDTTRTLLEDRALQDEDGGPRSTALQVLANKWPDESTRKLLEDRALEDEHQDARSTALQALAKTCPNEATRELLEDRALQDEDGGPRSTALRALAGTWSDEATRKLLEDRALQDEHQDARSTALQALAETWPDETTRELLEDRAAQDEHQDARGAALQALAEKKWLNEATRKLLKEHTGVNGFAASRVGGWHSGFGRIVFTRDLDGVAPYLDPTEPISQDHIERAAARAGIPADEIGETVQALSEHLGWDITKGAAG